MKILIVIDMQNDFINGSLANPAAEAIVDSIVEYIHFHWGKNNPIILTRDTHSENYLNSAEGKILPIEHCIEGTSGWCVNPKIIDAVRPIYDHQYVNKYDAFGYRFWDRELSSLLSKHSGATLDHIYICGTCTSICVVSNALILKTLLPDIPITVFSYLCADVSEEKHKAALEVMRSCQIEVI